MTLTRWRPSHDPLSISSTVLGGGVMYKTTSRNAQNAREHTKLADMADGEQILTPEQKRDSLKSRLKQIDADILQAKKDGKPKSYIKKLGKEKYGLAQAMKAIRPKVRLKDRGVPQHFVDAAREMLPGYTFKKLMSEASRRAQATSESDPSS